MSRTIRTHGSTSPAAAPAEDALTALTEEWREVVAEQARLWKLYDDAEGRPEEAELERRFEATLDRRFALERRIVATPALTLAGVAFKLQVLRLLMAESRPCDKASQADERFDVEKRFALSALRDVEQMIGA
ncbi:hypothetical protein [Rhodospirillaceae bacterium SYSU D60014]|uniref:hypothetical protein n=1 Tax=Virgifigura deserti TaxID=2268457 RepID=UPI000E666630